IGLVAVLLIWHVANDAFVLVVLGAWISSSVVLVWLWRRGYGHTAAAASIVAVVILLHLNVGVVLGRNASARINGVRRMGLRENPIIRFLVGHVGLEPGGKFRGYAEDAYGRLPSRHLNEEIVTHWVQNWQWYGNGMKLFAWNVFGIP